MEESLCVSSLKVLCLEGKLIVLQTNIQVSAKYYLKKGIFWAKQASEQYLKKKMYLKKYNKIR